MNPIIGVEAPCHDVRHALQTMRKGPGSTVVGVLSLALVIGANTVIFTFVKAALMNRLAVRMSVLLLLAACASNNLPVLGSALTSPPSDYGAIVARLRNDVPALITKRNIPGIAIALVDGEAVIWTEGFGHTDRTMKTAVTPDTVFSIQSISKSYTTTGFLVAVSKGLVDIDDPIRKHIPSFQVKSRFGRQEAQKITLRHLLSHRSGLPHEAPCGNNWDPTPCGFDRHVRSISDTWLKFPVGDRYSYSNLGFDLVGYVLEARTGRPFWQFMRDELFEPLGMNLTTFHYEDAMQARFLALGQTADRTLEPRPLAIIPSGGMYSTVTDMAKFISFHLTGGRVGGRQLIRGDVMRQMYEIQFPMEHQVGGYGLGIVRGPWRGGTMLNHNGGGHGYGASQTWLPEYGIGAVVLTNAGHGASTAAELANNALRLMIERKLGTLPDTINPKWTDKPVVRLSPDWLRRLQGTYKPRGSTVTFQLVDETLQLVSGTERTELNAHSPTEFTSTNRLFTFVIGDRGVSKGVKVLGLFDGEYWPVNDRPGELPGPNRRRWRPYVGTYRGEGSDQSRLAVEVRNGYLYLSWQGGLKLQEHNEGLFFTADGETVVFQRSRLLIGNRPFVQSPD